jgi:hypothetical protein
MTPENKKSHEPLPLKEHSQVKVWSALNTKWLGLKIFFISSFQGYVSGPGLDLELDWIRTWTGSGFNEIVDLNPAFESGSQIRIQGQYTEEKMYFLVIYRYITVKTTGTGTIFDF